MKRRDLFCLALALPAAEALATSVSVVIKTRPIDPYLTSHPQDVVYTSIDLPYAEQIAARRRAMLPPSVQEALLREALEIGRLRMRP